MASILALVAAFLFALAATLQQKGALNLSELSLRDPASLARLVGQTTWLLGTGALLIGYVFQAAALDRGRLSIIQPLLVMTIVFALPLGYFLTSQHVGRKEVLGAAVIVVGLALFAIYGDPAGGRENAPGSEWAIAIAIIVVVCAVLLFLRRAGRADDEGRRLRDRGRHPLRPLGGADEADARLPPRRDRRAPLRTGSPMRSRSPGSSGSCSSRSRSGPASWRRRSRPSRSPTRWSASSSASSCSRSG